MELKWGLYRVQRRNLYTAIFMVLRISCKTFLSTNLSYIPRLQFEVVNFALGYLVLKWYLISFKKAKNCCAHFIIKWSVKVQKLWNWVLWKDIDLKQLEMNVFKRFFGWNNFKAFFFSFYYIASSKCKDFCAAPCR